MYIPKRYGQSRIETCVVCGKTAVSMNKQGLPVCAKHKQDSLNHLKCSCGSFLEPRQGKFGAFFLCHNCGPINLKKGLEMQDMMENKLYKVQAKKPASNENNKENQNNNKENNQNNNIRNSNYNSSTANKERKEDKPKERKIIVVRTDDPIYFS